MEPNKRELYLHSLMCIVGGYLGGYAVLSRAGTFGSAQTLNMIEIVCTLLGRDYYHFFLRIICLVLYVSGIFLGLFLMKKTTVHMQRYAILVDVVGMILLCMIPSDVDVILGVMPIFFMMATQWTIFHGNGKYNSSTIFSTNNLKQLTLSLGTYLLERDASQLEKAKFFGNSILWYHVGVAASFFACRAFAVQASLCALPFVCAAMAITFIPDRYEVVSGHLVR
jgi:uncharacterized membrane protein YoaK (UPF0700 family)